MTFIAEPLVNLSDCVKTEMAKTKLKNEKSLGYFQIPSELIKERGDKELRKLWMSLCKDVKGRGG